MGQKKISNDSISNKKPKNPEESHVTFFMRLKERTINVKRTEEANIQIHFMKQETL